MWCIYLYIFIYILINTDLIIWVRNEKGFPVDTPLVLRLDKDAYGKKPFFSWTEALFNHAVKLYDYWFVQCIKKWTNRSAVELHKPMAKKSARMSGAIWLYKRPFRHRILRFLLLQQRQLFLHWSQKPTRCWHASQLEPATSNLLGWSATFSSCSSIAAVPVPFSAAIRWVL